MQRLNTQLCLSLLLLSLGGSQAQKPGYKVQVQSLVKVQEGLWVLVPCSFSYPSQEAGLDSSQAHGYWFTEGTNTDTGEPVASTNPARPTQGWTQGRFQLLGDPHRNDCTLFIRDAQKEDKKNYFFRVEKGEKLKYNFLVDMFRLEVTALTQPHIFIPETLEPGRAVTIICMVPCISQQCVAPSISWSGPALSSTESRPQTSFLSAISLTPRLRDHGTQLTCRADFRAGNTVENTVRLSVACAPRDLVITILHDNAQGGRSSGRAGPTLEKWKAQESKGNMTCVDVRKGQFLRLLCTAAGWPPPTMTWVLGNQVLLRSNATHPGNLGLDLPRVKVRDAGRYTCHAENRLGSQRHSLNVCVQCAGRGSPGHCVSIADSPEALTVTASQGNSTELEIHRNGSSLHVLQGQSLRLVCVTHSHPTATLTWTQGSKMLSPPWPAEPGVLELPMVQAEHEGEFTCRAQNPLGDLHISLSLSVHYEGSISAAFSKGAGLGIGATSLLFLCLIVLIVKMLRKSQPHTETCRTHVSPHSTVLDNSIVNPKARVPKKKAKPSSPPRTASPGAGSPEPRKKEKAALSCPEPASPTQDPDSETARKKSIMLLSTSPGLLRS
ncbi:PREDICTED: sialic acid-binding Ig-like lectin 10 [Dipodomys ordii]|uniref:Sialic acid-binding Ig-like lectin 10 n=1 Tax=Dipodomys ordii TaxID=10020 RepID=A0A1S3G318_DIPOR|nr:PREDICTED: sialic acid-binding Ig-like lectin 10 [Dipodomys ordii]